MYEIKTSDRVKTLKVLVDGNEWTMKLQGAGDTLKLVQMQRRHGLIQKKLDEGTATLEELDIMDRFEEMILENYEGIFNDGTADNNSVKTWVRSTPFDALTNIVAEIQKQYDGNTANA